MKQAIECAFPQAVNCLESSDSMSFGVKEIEQRSYLVENPEDGILKIDNQSKKLVYLLAIDRCMFTNEPLKRCDCAVFDNEQLYFIEIKNCNPKNRDDHRSNAAKQLKITIDTFKDNGFDKPLKAMIAWSGEIHPIQTLKQMNASVKFKQETGIVLLEGNEIQF